MQPSLVKYRYPQLEQTVKAAAPKALLQTPRLSQNLLSSTDATAEDLLDSILPPREWNQNGEVWTQRVSSTPATRADVVAVEEELDKRLKQRGARDYGICSVRHHLHSECFDEILRQYTSNPAEAALTLHPSAAIQLVVEVQRITVAVACAERGLLLHRVRTELSTMIRAYQKLYESSAAFGLRKALQLDDKKNTVSLRLEELKRNKEHLTQEVEMLQEYVARIGRSSRENIEKEEHEHTAVFTVLRRKSQKVKHELERLLSVATQK